jgi:hypothetical protein
VAPLATRGHPVTDLARTVFDVAAIVWWGGLAVVTVAVVHAAIKNGGQ